MPDGDFYNNNNSSIVSNLPSQAIRKALGPRRKDGRLKQQNPNAYQRRGLNSSTKSDNVFMGKKIRCVRNKLSVIYERTDEGEDQIYF